MNRPQLDRWYRRPLAVSIPIPSPSTTCLATYHGYEKLPAEKPQSRRCRIRSTASRSPSSAAVGCRGIAKTHSPTGNVKSSPGDGAGLLGEGNDPAYGVPTGRRTSRRRIGSPGIMPTRQHWQNIPSRVKRLANTSCAAGLFNGKASSSAVPGRTMTKRSPVRSVSFHRQSGCPLCVATIRRCGRCTSPSQRVLMAFLPPWPSLTFLENKHFDGLPDSPVNWLP